MKNIYLLICLLITGTSVMAQGYEVGEIFNAKMKLGQEKYFIVNEGFAYSLKETNLNEITVHVVDTKTLKVVSTFVKKGLKFANFLVTKNQLYVLHYPGDRRPKELICTELNKVGFGKSQVIFKAEKIPLVTYGSYTEKVVQSGTSANGKFSFISISILNGGVPGKLLSDEVKVFLFDENLKLLNNITVFLDTKVTMFSDATIGNEGIVYFVGDGYEDRKLTDCFLFKVSPNDDDWDETSVEKVKGSEPKLLLKDDRINVLGCSFVEHNNKVQYYNGIQIFTFDKTLKNGSERNFSFPASTYSNLKLKKNGSPYFKMKYISLSAEGEIVGVIEEVNQEEYIKQTQSGPRSYIRYENKGLVAFALKNDELKWSLAIPKYDNRSLDFPVTDAGFWGGCVNGNLYLYYMDIEKNKSLDSRISIKNRKGGYLVKVQIPVSSGVLNREFILNVDGLSNSKQYKSLKGKLGPINISQSYMNSEEEFVIEMRNSKSGVLFKFKN